MVTGNVLIYKTGETGPYTVSSGLLDAVPLTVQFKVQVTSGTPLAFHWDFGDGSTSDIREPYHTYESYGFYRIFLTVTDSVETSVFPYFDIHLGKLDFSAGRVNGLAPLTVTFLNNSVAPSGYYFTGMQWDFGDGSTGMVASPTHVYTSDGKYNVSISAMLTNV